MKFEIADNAINGPQIVDIRKLPDRLRGCHFVNIRVRKNGKWQEYEADWLRYLLEQPACAEEIKA